MNFFSMFYFIWSTFCVACSLISLYSLLNIFPFYGCITICSSNLLLMNTLVISGLGKFLNTLSYACPVVHLQVFLLAINLIVDLLVHWLFGPSTSVTSNHFSKVVVSICILLRNVWVFHLLHILANIWYGQTFSFSNWFCSSISFYF